MKTASNYLDYFGWNPQLLREIKGKLKQRNIIATIAASVIAQFAIVIYHLSELPDYKAGELPRDGLTESITEYSRYCIETLPTEPLKGHLYHLDPALCSADLKSSWIINWNVFWWDIFLILSVIGIGLLLVLGTYFLISNFLTENKQDTLGLVRLSPQSASSIFLGKILGVPILLYLGIATAFPMHLVSALQAGINLGLLIGFYVAVVASCAFFYSLGLLVSLLFPFAIVSWIFAGAIALFLSYLSLLTTYIHEASTSSIFDWLLFFNPNNLLLALGETTGIHYRYFDFEGLSHFRSGFDPNNDMFFFDSVLFYGKAIGTKTGMAIGAVIANFSLWTYWLWQALTRRYYNPQSTAITKTQSYWITAWFMVLSLGFSLQDISRYNDGWFGEDRFLLNMSLLKLVLATYFVALMFLLTPHRQTLSNWARYRHQVKGKTWQQLVFNEESPAVVAIMLNMAIAIIYALPSLFMFTLRKDANIVALSIVLIVGTIVFYSTLVQLLFLNKSKHPVVIAGLVLATLSIGIPMCVGIITPSGSLIDLVLLFTPFSLAVSSIGDMTQAVWVIMGQWLAIAVVSLQIRKNLRIAGRSESYAALTGKPQT